jgi:hypothetical protein
MQTCYLAVSMRLSQGGVRREATIEKYRVFLLKQFRSRLLLLSLVA